MKNSMLSLDIYAWLQESRNTLEGGFIKKIYQIDEHSFLLKIYKGETQSLFIDLRGWIYFGEKETPMEPSMFAMFLRKRFSNRKILGVYQLNFDRIVVFEMSDNYSLIFELFGEGNVIVVKDGIIERGYREREWRHRAILRGEEYKGPPPRHHPVEDIDELCEVINNSKYDVVRVLALEYNMGKYAEEVCLRAGVNKNAKKINEDECDKIKNALRSLFNFEGGFVYEDFFSPVPLRNRDFQERYETFNEAIAKYAERGIIVVSEEEQKLKRRIEEQRKLIEEYRKKEEEYRKIGDLLYAHFVEVEKSLKLAAEGKIPYDRKNGKMRVNLEDTEITLDVKKSAGQNASVYYEKAKKMAEKIKGAERALEESEEALQKAKKERKREKKKVSHRKHFWFEKYRWFISSEGFLVIGGRDAKTNEEVVKKHMGDGDLYMHADIHGAPSIVIKSEGREIGEKTLEEAAQFAVSMSKGWNAGFGNLAAYWVYPSQVSKMGESGEYVTRGAWVVHGKRNYIHHVPLRLAVGMVGYQGVTLLMCGPVSAVTSKTGKYIIIEPGDIKKDAFAKIVSRVFSVPVDEALRILPPGGVRVVENTVEGT